MTWFAPALLGSVLGLVLYWALDLPRETPLVASLFVVAGVLLTSLGAYGFRRFLLPQKLEESE